jgi:hypothetical protein
MTWTTVQDAVQSWSTQAEVENSVKVYVLPTSGTSSNPTTAEWIVPPGVNLIKVEAIGTGGMGVYLPGYFGGGGGAYARTNKLQVNPGQKLFYQSISGSNLLSSTFDAWLNINENTAPTSSLQGVLSKRGEVGTPAGGGVGGQASACIGDIAFSGGNGGASTFGGAGGGGGAAGPNGNGANGGAGFDDITIDGAGGGGGANGGSNGQDASLSEGRAGSGGNNRFGVGGGIAGTLSTQAGLGVDGGGGGGAYATSTSGNLRRGSAGGMEIIWTDSLTGQTFGPGGGGGGSRGIQLGGSGASYGGGSGGFSGVPGTGLIVVTVLGWIDAESQAQSWTDVS